MIAAGLGNALSSLLGSLALDAFSVNPRVVILAALPLEAIVLFFALTAYRKMINTPAETGQSARALGRQLVERRSLY